MATVRHTIKIIYGNSTGTETIYCQDSDDIETVKAKVIRDLGLNYLPMCEPKITIVATQRSTDG